MVEFFCWLLLASGVFGMFTMSYLAITDQLWWAQLWNAMGFGSSTMVRGRDRWIKVSGFKIRQSEVDELTGSADAAYLRVLRERLEGGPKHMISSSTMVQIMRMDYDAAVAPTVPKPYNPNDDWNKKRERTAEVVTRFLHEAMLSEEDVNVAATLLRLEEHYTKTWRSMH